MEESPSRSSTGDVGRIRGRSCQVLVVLCTALTASAAGATTRAHLVTGSDCTANATRTALASFIVAFNRGSYAKLDTLFARPPLFQWYASNAPGLRRTATAHDRNSLIAYFRARHLRRDRLRLVRFTFNGNAGGNGNFVFKLKRSASDYRRGAWFGLIGKAASVCSDDAFQQPVQLIVVSLGGPNSDKG